MRLDRRSLLLGTAALAAGASTRGFAQEQPGLRVQARNHGLVYGTCTDTNTLRNDPDLSAAVRTEAGILVAEYETKRSHVEPAPDAYDFGPTDFIAGFARANGQLMRGHTLVWHASNPSWLEEALASRPDEKLMTDYIRALVTRYRGRFHSWDVVNEAVEPEDGSPDGLRTSSPWHRAFGPGYIDTAFHAAREADPSTPLFYNETNVEGDERWFAKRRAATLKLLEGLVARKVPVQGFGMQGHLKLYRSRYSQATVSRFLDEVSAMGLKILVTELDVADIAGPADPARRDADVAALTKSFLDVCFSKPATLGCLTWGLSDKKSWLSTTKGYQWPDGQLSRGLPLDADCRRKPMWAAIADAIQYKHA